MSGSLFGRVAASLCLLFAGLAPLSAQAQDCDRECLGGMVTRYVDAMLAHDPSGLPLADNVRFTENSRVMALGEGAWQTITEARTFRHDYLDTAKQIAASHIELREGDTPVLLTVVLSIADQQITGIETQVSQITADSPFQPKVLGEPVRGLDSPIPAGQRMSRADMVATAMTYAEGLRIGNFRDAGTPFAPETYRVENGVITAGEGCAFSACGMYEGRIMLHPSLIPSVVAVDEENGNVLLWMNFGDTGSYGEDIALVTYEAFKIWGGSIHAINAFFAFPAASTSRFWPSTDPVPHIY